MRILNMTMLCLAFPVFVCTRLWPWHVSAKGVDNKLHLGKKIGRWVVRLLQFVLFIGHVTGEGTWRESVGQGKVPRCFLWSANRGDRCGVDLQYNFNPLCKILV